MRILAGALTVALTPLITHTAGSATRLESQFRLTYSMILNLLRVEDVKVGCAPMECLPILNAALRMARSPSPLPHHASRWRTCSSARLPSFTRKSASRSS